MTKLKPTYKLIIVLILVSLFFNGFSQDFNIWRTGSTLNSDTESFLPGIILAGGGTDQDNAMTWFLSRAGGGDVVVLRATGNDGYNSYLFSDLGVSVNSVTTIRFNSANAAYNPIVIQTILDAEAVFFAGGNQYDYYNYWKDTPIMDTLNYLINVKGITVGGTSAGMAILGQGYYAALPGLTPGITTEEALNNPFNIGLENLYHNNFLQIPYLENLITDTHYQERNREGRHSVFMAKLSALTNTQYFGIACNDYTAVTVDENGLARAWGAYPLFEEDKVFFLQANCQDDWLPETLLENIPLTWNRNQRAIKVYQLPANNLGTNNFSLVDWETGSGGTWQRWWIDNGVFSTSNSTIVGCEPESVSISEIKINNPMFVFPNPANNYITIEGFSNYSGLKQIKVFNLFGKEIFSETLFESNFFKLYLDNFSHGVYFLIVTDGSNNLILSEKIIKN